MANKRILVDTSIIIDFLRKKDKQNSVFWELMNNYNPAVSTITVFELYSGAINQQHYDDLDKIFKWIDILNFDNVCAEQAASIYKKLKSKNQLIEFRDIFIASTALVYNISLSTLNIKHFERIEKLNIV